MPSAIAETAIDGNTMGDPFRLDNGQGANAEVQLPALVVRWQA